MRNVGYGLVIKVFFYHFSEKEVSMRNGRWTMLFMLFVLWGIMMPQTTQAQSEPDTSTSWGYTASPTPVFEQDGSSQCNETIISVLEQYGTVLCGDTVNFYCLKIDETILEAEVKNGDTVTIKEKRGIPTWETLWGDTEGQIVRKINRTNLKLYKGQVLAVPRDMKNKTFMDFSPYPYKIDPPGEKLIIWDPGLLAFGAYDSEGNLVRWGPAAGGKDFCPDVKRGCRTKTGEFKIIRKEGPNYRSGRYPVGCSGNSCAKMPYASFFQGQGYAFHSGNVPGANASHGCVRVFYSDAEWLHGWLEIGTRVVIRPYPKKL